MTNDYILTTTYMVVMYLVETGFFVLLEGNKYCLSDAFVATSEDIYQVFAILKTCRSLIEAVASQTA